MSVAAMHGQVHQRAGQQQQIGQGRQNVARVSREEIDPEGGQYERNDPAQGGPTRRVLQLLGDVEDTFGVVFMAGPLDPTRLISNVPREPALISLKWEPEARTPGPRDTGLLVGITELDHVIGVGGRLRPRIHGRIEAGQRWRSAMVQLPQVPDAIDVRMEQPEDRIL
jgi:hypothetical protein